MSDLFAPPSSSPNQHSGAGAPGPASPTAPSPVPPASPATTAPPAAGYPVATAYPGPGTAAPAGAAARNPYAAYPPAPQHGDGGAYGPGHGASHPAPAASPYANPPAVPGAPAPGGRTGPSRVLVGVLAGVAGLVIGGVGATGVTLAVVAGNELFAGAEAAADPWPLGPAPDEESWDTYGDQDVAGRDGGTVEDPWLLSDEVYTEEWSVLLDAPYEATAEVLAHDDVNVPPADGMEYWIVPVHATYFGPSLEASAPQSITLELVDGTGAVFDGRCGVVPDGLTGKGFMSTDESVSGNVCLPVPAGAPGLWRLTIDDYMPVYLTTDPSTTES
ncbi:hypothetical protein [Oerskovia paurometabola]|uniref:Uncharacterized protein n=1 Tax=Oerskovia paurometabola TaxID=162170 RepID=A0ABW1X9F0_9CELL|nr:hypothetical protein [Oerskovia paurometabola]MBM7498122.1 hypothetical protein [Oerskovia paurometabola]